MYVKDTMTIDPFCINKDTKVSHALDIMNQNEFHRLPVVDNNGKLIGLITEGTITESSPSKATSLSIHEINYLLSKTPVEDIMIKNVKAIEPNALLEEAATLMRTHQIGCLPVVENDKVVGIITDNDIFDAFINLLGYNVSGSRYVINIKQDSCGVITNMTKCFADNQVNITNVSVYHGPRGIEVIIITTDKNVELMKKALTDAGYDLISAETRN
ncbi:MAG: CBS domain-containing protein [Erysipelotrichaceae bacterium]|nr:CBS domain-containing protein [Erysipelotrichaceae bacterium]